MLAQDYVTLFVLTLDGIENYTVTDHADVIFDAREATTVHVLGDVHYLLFNFALAHFFRKF